MKVRLLHPDAQVPRYASEGAACFDLHSVDSMVIGAGAAHTFRTGLAIEMPPKTALLIYSRSGHGFKAGVRLSNCVGVIDSDYRGEIMVRLHNDGLQSFAVSKGDRIAQAMPQQMVEPWLIQIVDELSDTERGTGGLGSTGA